MSYLIEHKAQTIFVSASSVKETAEAQDCDRKPPGVRYCPTSRAKDSFPLPGMIYEAAMRTTQKTPIGS